MVNQRVIAAELGLSVATVSRALRGRGNHDARTRALVREAAERLGYRLPDRPVDGEAQDVRVPAIGVTIANDLPHRNEPPTVSMRVLRGISNAARSLGLMLHVEYLTVDNGQLTHDPLASPAFRAGNLAGLIHIGHIPAIVLAAVTRRFPGVRFALRDPTVPMDCIGQDDLTAATALVDHLAALGHERIGFFGDGVLLSFARARLAGHTQAMLMRGTPLQELALVNVRTPARTTADCTEDILAHVARGVRAWVCVHDGRGFQLVNLLQKAGLRVPEDVSVCGFDALQAPDGLPRLTSIDWPFEDIGAEAVRRLLRRLEAPSEPLRQVVFSGQVLAGASTARRSALESHVSGKK